MSTYLHFKPSQFIHDVRGNDFNSNEYDMRQSLRLQAAKRAFLALPIHEQEKLARIADKLPGRTARMYGTITAFEVLAAVSVGYVGQPVDVSNALDRMEAE